MVFDPKKLAGHWVEVREEGGDGRLVLRPADSDIPPARGRRSLVLDSSGATQAQVPGPDDRGIAAGSGNWTLDADTLTIAAGEFSGKYQVEQVDGDKLVLKAR